MNISVIIPTYNRAHIIKKSIQSVLDQTISPFEIIVVDDYSTDNTREVIESLNSNKVKYVLNHYSKGANGARNTGIMLANGRYIAFQDSDDLWISTKLEKQLEFMKNNKDFDMCFCSLLIMNSNRGVVPKRNVETCEIEKKLLIRNFISTQTIFIKKEVAQKHLFDEKLKRQQDWDFCLRVSKKHKIKHLNEVLVHVEIQPDSISTNEKILNAFSNLFEKHPELTTSCFANRTLNQKIQLYKNYKLSKYFSMINHMWKYFLFKLLERIFERGDKL